MSPGPYFENYPAQLPFQSITGTPNRKDFGKNGTFLVFRQMEQHVERFWHYMYHNSREDAATTIDQAIKLAAKMVGRWPEGQPLATNHDIPAETKDLNEFEYSKDDAHGLGCPFGAHVRRTNPRDQNGGEVNIKLSIEMSNKHRMLRRGRVYGDPIDPDFNVRNMIEMVKDKPKETAYALNLANMENGNSYKDQTGSTKIEIKRGVHFMCLVSDISRQFEFVQSVWANTRTFGDLSNEADPIISPGYTNDKKTHADFTTPQVNIRNRYRAVPEFTNVVGGEYFFLPSITALKYLVDIPVLNQKKANADSLTV
ncbi:MAG: hypothetical protein EOO07_12015 [Chitinophagaceae bacterium]|nr:MAG: hypothetical protein EOO07_12015 [Chitinophagaceae bacterium]